MVLLLDGPTKQFMMHHILRRGLPRQQVPFADRFFSADRTVCRPLAGDNQSNRVSQRHYGRASRQRTSPPSSRLPAVSMLPVTSCLCIRAG
jgi:hypothetical protein